MAKWGEGDPRWIVEERPDGTNVNNWHWTEKNATGWSKDKIKSLLEGFKHETDEGSFEITEVPKIEGEASASNRKAKLIFFYEWEIKADWSGKLAGSNTKYKGKIEVPNLSEENDPEDLDIRVSVTSEKDEAYKVKEFVRKMGTKPIQQQLGNYIRDLKIEFSQGMILQSKKHEGNAKEPTTAKIPNEAKKKMAQPVKSDDSGTVGVKIPCRRITDKVEFKCRADNLYRALTDKQMVCAFTRNEVEMEAEKGGRFSLFGGNVKGEFVELIPDEKIVMRWRFKTWPDEHYSMVTLDLEEKDDCTEMTLLQTGVPVNELDRTKDGWKNYYWESMKQTFGFGAHLL